GVKKVVVTEATIRDALRLNDAEGVEYLPNEEIFAELARMGYEKPSTKLTHHTAIKQVGDLSTHTTKYTSPALTQKVFSNMRRVGKGFSRVETLFFEGMMVVKEVGEGVADEVHDEGVPAASIVAKRDVSAANDEVPIVQPQSPQPQPQQDAGIPINLFQEVMDTCTALTRRVEHLELDKIAQALEITKLKIRVKKLERRNKIKVLMLRRLQKVGTTQRVETFDETVMDDVSNQGRMIAKMDQDADVVLDDDKEVADEVADDVKDVQDDINESDESEPSKVQEVVDVVTTAKIIIEVVTAASETITAASTTITVVEAQVPVATLTAAPARVTTAPSRRKKEEDFEALWVLVKERFATTKPNNFSDDFLLITLGAMFEKPDIHAQIWKNQRSVHGPTKVKGWKLLESCGVQNITFTTTQLILLVERNYTLIRFTLDQMLNDVRLEVEEESEVSLELLSFGVDAAKEVKKNMLNV
nr:hypothetical protein [Tanacetum cinerariifolium]